MGSKVAKAGPSTLVAPGGVIRISQKQHPSGDFPTFRISRDSKPITFEETFESGSLHRKGTQIRFAADDMKKINRALEPLLDAVLQKIHKNTGYEITQIYHVWDPPMEFSGRESENFSGRIKFILREIWFVNRYRFIVSFIVDELTVEPLAAE